MNKKELTTANILFGVFAISLVLYIKINCNNYSIVIDKLLKKI